MNKEIQSKFSLKTRLALALSTLAFVTAGCGNYERAPSYGDCLNAGGSNEQCLEIWDPNALSMQETAQASQKTQIPLPTETPSPTATEEVMAPTHAYVQANEGILDVLIRLGVQISGYLGPMQLSQRFFVLSPDGQRVFHSWTLKDLLEGKADNVTLEEGYCIGTYDPRNDPNYGQQLWDQCFGKENQ